MAVNRIKIIVLVLAVVLFSVLLFTFFGGQDQVEKKIIHLPLDDRPANKYIPQKIGEIAGITVENMPEKLFEKISPKSEGFDPALIDDMGEYLLNNGEDADAFVISADMLFFGGLVSSRNLYPEAEGLDSEKGLVEDSIEKGVFVIEELENKYPETPVYVYSTIQRLAPNLNEHIGEDEYEHIRYFAVNYDRVINKGMEEYETRFESFQREVEKLDDGILDGYLKSREMNQEKNKRLLELLAGDYLDYLIISQDDAYEYGLHRVEREELEKIIKDRDLEERTEIFAGTDEVDSILISRFINETSGREPSVYPSYPDLKEAGAEVGEGVEEGEKEGVGNGEKLHKPEEWIFPLEDISLKKNIEARVRAMGAKMAERREDADINLYVNTFCFSCSTERAPGDLGKDLSDGCEMHGALKEDESEISLDGLLNAMDKFGEQIELGVQSGENVAVADVAKLNGGCVEFVDVLLDRINPLKLYSYSGWNTAGNSLGQALAQANSRSFFQEVSEEAEEVGQKTDKDQKTKSVKNWQLCDERKKKAIEAHAELIFHRFAKDYFYLSKIREEIRDYVEYLEIDNNELGEKSMLVLDYLRLKLVPRLEYFYRDHFAGARIGVERRECECCSGFTGLECKEGKGATSNSYVIRELLGMEFDFPWDRLFEVDIKPEFVFELE